MSRAEIRAWLDRNRDHPRAEGISAVDLLDLPPVLNQVVRVLLTHEALTQVQIAAALVALPDTLWRQDRNLAFALDGLVEQQWLRRVAGNSPVQDPVYRVNLRTQTRTTVVSSGWECSDF